jgi:hypothetical protein
MRSVAVVLLFAAFAPAATRDVTVLVDFEKPHSEVSIAALRQELKELLEPAGVSVEVKLRSELPTNPEFSELVVFHMKGSCSMDMVYVPITEPPSELGPLAMAYSSDGQILHFGEVECDRVRQCVQRVTGLGGAQRHQAAYGAALAIVIAHEIYHMICGAKEHTKSGLTKESLSAHELLDGSLSIPLAVRELMRRDFPGESAKF